MYVTLRHSKGDNESVPYWCTFSILIFPDILYMLVIMTCYVMGWQYMLKFAPMIHRLINWLLYQSWNVSDPEANYIKFSIVPHPRTSISSHCLRTRHYNLSESTWKHTTLKILLHLGLRMFSVDIQFWLTFERMFKSLKFQHIRKWRWQDPA